MSWCDAALCTRLRQDNRSTCDPCGRRWLFIVAAGRSGSSSLLQAVNALPDFQLRGEFQFNLMAGLLSSYRSLTAQLEPRESELDACCHHGALSERALTCDMQALLTDAMGVGLQSGSVLGFKELATRMSLDNDIGFREHNGTCPHIEPTLLQLSRLFPCSRFIISHRQNVAAQRNSSFFRTSDDQSEGLEVCTQNMLAAHRALGPERSVALPLEAFKLSTFTAVAGWLGSNCTFVQMPHANTHSGLHWGHGAAVRCQ